MGLKEDLLHRTEKNFAIDKLIEEMAELTFELAKYKYNPTNKRVTKLKAEIEDVKLRLKNFEKLLDEGQSK